MADKRVTSLVEAFRTARSHGNATAQQVAAKQLAALGLGTDGKPLRDPAPPPAEPAGQQAAAGQRAAATEPRQPPRERQAPRASKT